jgi:hypothetical protein
MSFGVLPFTGGHDGITRKTLPNMQSTRRNIIRYEPRGRRPTYQANQGPVTWRKGPKPKANVLQIGPNFAGVAYAVLEAYKTKIRPKRHL